MSEIEFTTPDENTPGFLRRQLKIAEFQEMLRDGDMKSYYIELANFLLPFVTKPVDRDKAHEALLDCTQKQFRDLLNAAYGVVTNPTSAPEIETN